VGGCGLIKGCRRTYGSRAEFARESEGWTTCLDEPAMEHGRGWGRHRPDRTGADDEMGNWCAEQFENSAVMGEF
jgi:hypothetical protein